jgi:hypothetical protein
MMHECFHNNFSINKWNWNAQVCSWGGCAVLPMQYRIQVHTYTWIFIVIVIVAVCRCLWCIWTWLECGRIVEWVRLLNSAVTFFVTQYFQSYCATTYQLTLPWQQNRIVCDLVLLGRTPYYLKICKLNIVHFLFVNLAPVSCTEFRSILWI